MTTIAKSFNRFGETNHYMEGTPIVRPSIDADVEAIASIYAHHVDRGTGSFETAAPDAGEVARRRAEVLASGLPWLVLERAGRVDGYAYAGAFRTRPAYRFCVEDSIYLRPDAIGLGLGRLLLADLVERCEAYGARQMLALIGDSANAASIGVHRALGFREAGVLAGAGWKFGRWLDVVVMQRSLGAGSGTPPE